MEPFGELKTLFRSPCMLLPSVSQLEKFLCFLSSSLEITLRPVLTEFDFAVTFLAGTDESPLIVPFHDFETVGDMMNLL